MILWCFAPFPESSCGWFVLKELLPHSTFYVIYTVYITRISNILYITYIFYSILSTKRNLYHLLCPLHKLLHQPHLHNIHQPQHIHFYIIFMITIIIIIIMIIYIIYIIYVTYSFIHIIYNIASHQLLDNSYKARTVSCAHKLFHKKSYTGVVNRGCYTGAVIQDGTRVFYLDRYKIPISQVSLSFSSGGGGMSMETRPSAEIVRLTDGQTCGERRILWPSALCAKPRSNGKNRGKTRQTQPLRAKWWPDGQICVVKLLISNVATLQASTCTVWGLLWLKASARKSCSVYRLPCKSFSVEKVLRKSFSV